MKKTCIYALALACLFSCAKEGLDNNGSVSSFRALAPQSKTTVDGVHVLWTDQDAISLYDGQQYTTSLASPSASAEFTGSGASLISGNYLAVYPSSAVSTWNQTAASVELPCDQIANPDGFPSGAALMYAKSSTAQMTFNHAVGYVKFEIDPSAVQGIKSVSVISRGNDNLCGKAALDCLNGEIAVTDGKPFAVLSNSDESALAAGTYHIALFPGTFASGLTFRFITEEGYADVDLDGPLSLAAGQVQSIGKVRNLVFAAFPKIGDLYSEENNAKGVYFYIKNYDSMVVSLGENTGKVGADKNLKWDNTDCKSGLENMALFHSLAPDNFSTAFPMPYWAENYGEPGWFIGIGDDLTKLMNQVKESGFDTFNAFLTSNEGTAIQDDKFYFSSTAASDDTKSICKKYTVSSKKVTSGNYAKDGSRPVRAFKNVNFKTDKNL